MYTILIPLHTLLLGIHLFLPQTPLSQVWEPGLLGSPAEEDDSAAHTQDHSAEGV